VVKINKNVKLQTKEVKLMVFGERLRLLRHRKYSQEELANLLHVHNNTISKWESGTQAPRMNKMRELASILGTTVAYLLGDTDNPLPTGQLEIPIEEGAIEHTHQRSKEESSSNREMLVYMTKNGERFEAPPTEEGIKFIERIMSRASSQQNMFYPSVTVNNQAHAKDNAHALVMA
jgi:transcriptional regulator with XRE-family HTH domain